MAGLRKNFLRISVGGDEHNFEVSKALFTSKKSESDFLSFADAESGGGLDYFLDLTILQDPGNADSLWNLMFDHAGETADVVVKYESATISATTPAFTATVRIKIPEGTILGGEADASESARHTVDVSWPTTTGKPVRDTTP